MRNVEQAKTNRTHTKNVRKAQDEITSIAPDTEARKRGGNACFEKYGKVYYQTIGKKGGNITRQRHDAAYYQRIGALGREARRRKKQAYQTYASSLLTIDARMADALGKESQEEGSLSDHGSQ